MHTLARPRAILIALLVVTVAPSVGAQDTPPQSADLLRRLFSPGEFTAKSFGPARWLEGGRAYTTMSYPKAS